MTPEIRKDLESLINHSLGMAEKLLMEQNEFYPFGATIDSNEEQTSVGFYEGDEFPTSESIIQGLKSSFEKRIANQELRAFAITYDSTVKESVNSVKADAVTIEHFDVRSGLTTRYFYPYKLTIQSKVEFGEPWATQVE